jgi:hypothetical protein
VLSTLLPTSIQQLTQRNLTAEGQRFGLRLADRRVMALLAALACSCICLRAFAIATCAPHVAALLGENLQQYTAAKMSYDLRRLRLKGLISRKAGTTSSLQTSAIVVAQNREVFAQQVGSFQIRLPGRVICESIREIPPTIFLLNKFTQRV